jgi:hypothetical protein
MPDLKSELINIQQQIRSSIETQQIIERQIQYLIDGIESSPDRSVESIEAQIQSLMSSFGQTLYQELKEELSKDIGYVCSQIDEIKKERTPHEPVLSPILSGYSPTNQQVILVSEPANQRQNIPNSLQKLVGDYNQFGISFGNDYLAKEVDETKNSAEKRRNSSHRSVILSPFTPGKFWLIEFEGYSYLFPNPKQSFNTYSLDLLRSFFLFQDSNYSAGYKSILLGLPAILCADQSDGGTAWQLEEKGSIISFKK